MPLADLPLEGEMPGRAEGLSHSLNSRRITSH
ncbi:hypothetical protein QE372_000877 [Agrobacterium pusense]|nr:hypothetical protein [Agrobacterium pusense]